MSDSLAWVSARHPPPPPDLLQRVERALTTGAVGTASAEGTGPPERSTEAEPVGALANVEGLIAASRAELASAAATTGRVRRSAFELLVADALVTYACEAALEAERPLEALLRIVEVGREP